MNTTAGRTATDQVYTRRERIDWSFNAGGSGDFANWKVTPINAQMFPELANIAGSYSRYQFTQISFRYIPRTTTQTSASLVMGWQPTVVDDVEPYHDPRKMNALVVSATAPVRQGFAVTVPRRYLTDIKRLKPETDNYDDNMYHLGHFFAFGYGEEMDDVGDVFVEYTVRLLERQLDDSAAANGINVLTQTPADSFSVTGWTPITGEDRIWRCNTAKYLRIIYYATFTTTGDISIAVDAGGGFAAVAPEWKRTDGAHVVGSYLLSVTAADQIRFDHDNNATTAKAIVIRANSRLASL